MEGPYPENTHSVVHIRIHQMVKKILTHIRMHPYAYTLLYAYAHSSLLTGLTRTPGGIHITAAPVVYNCGYMNTNSYH